MIFSWRRSEKRWNYILRTSLFIRVVKNTVFYSVFGPSEGICSPISGRGVDLGRFLQCFWSPRQKNKIGFDSYFFVSEARFWEPRDFIKNNTNQQAHFCRYLQRFWAILSYRGCQLRAQKCVSYRFLQCFWHSVKKWRFAWDIPQKTDEALLRNNINQDTNFGWARKRVKIANRSKTL